MVPLKIFKKWPLIWHFVVPQQILLLDFNRQSDSSSKVVLWTFGCMITIGMGLVALFNFAQLKMHSIYIHTFSEEMRLVMIKGRDTLTPLPFAVMWDRFWQWRSASYLVNIRSGVKTGPHVYEI